MKFVILCALFAPIVYLALKQKKWYLYLLFAFISVLPEQFSVRLHDSLPLLTASRILIVVAMGFWFYDKWKTRQFHIPKSLLAFLAVNLIISLVNLRYGTDDLKRIFLLIFERALLVVVIVDTIHVREEFDRCIDFAIMGCMALAVIGIVQTVFDYDISTVLHLTKTFTSTQLSQRMGLVRAYSTYNAISYGCYCAFMAMLILYRLYNTKKIWFSVAFALNFVALICTFTRSAWLCLGGIALVVLVLYRLRLVRRMLASMGMMLALLVVLCCIQPKLYTAFVETGKSSINTIIDALPDGVTALFTPEQTVASTEPATTAAPTVPAETVAPTEPATTAAPTVPAETVAPTEPATTAAPTVPAETVAPTEPATAAAPTVPAETVAPTEPATAAAPTVPAETVAPTVPAPTVPAETVAPTEPVTTAAPTVPAETIAPTEPAASTNDRPGFQLDKDFGLNADNPAYSRTAQWTAVEYMAKEGQLLFGYGYNAYPRGKIYVFYDQWAAKWEPAFTLDVGFVALFAESGLIGVVAYMGLLVYMMVVAFIKRSRENEFDFNRLLIYMIPLYLLFNILAAFLDASVVWLLFGLFYAYQKLDKKEQLQ